MTQSPAKLKTLFSTDRVVFALQARTKKEVVQELAGALVATEQLKEKDTPKFIKEIMAREALGTTAIGKGIAIPHVRSKLASELIGVLGFSPDGIDFDSLDKQPTHVVFMLASPMADKDQQIRILGRIAGVANHANFLSFLLQCKSAQQIVDLLEEIETEVPAG